MKSGTRRNRYAFGLGTVGRDMLYTLVSIYFMYYLTDVLDLKDSTMWYMTGALTALRIFDALNDPVMGILVDNTHGRWGKFKPWITAGGVASALLTILLFTDFGFTGIAYLVSFILFYLFWDLSYGANDIAYYSMLPSLTTDPRERERIGSFARISANIGMYAAVIGIPAITRLMGDDTDAWFKVAVGIAVITLAFQAITIFGVKEDKAIAAETENTPLKELFSVLLKNDQLMITALSLGLFMIGYVTTTSFGIYYFKYAYKDENMYMVFAGILGVSQLAALSVFPKLMQRMTRSRLYGLSIMLVTAGYVLFFVSPMNMIPIGIAGILIFIGQAFIQVLQLMFLADTVEYGQWKLGRRNESITFSVQPFINKIGGAVASGILGVTLILSGINSAKTPDDVTESGLFLMKIAMLILPLISILAGYLVYRAKFRIDRPFYDRIVQDLKNRGEL